MKFRPRIAALVVFGALIVAIAGFMVFHDGSSSPGGKPAKASYWTTYCIVNGSVPTVVYHQSGPSGDIKAGNC